MISRSCLAPGERVDVTCVTNDARCDLLFTMSDITRLSQSHETRASRVHTANGREFVSSDEFEIPTGGARRDRTDDLLLAKQALSQLSYGPLRDQYVGNQS